MATTSSIHNPAECLADMHRLQRDFYSSYDPSHVLQQARQILQQPAKFDSQLIGEGLDSCSYRVSEGRHALSVPKPSYWNQVTPERWQERMRHLRSLKEAPLLPPIEILQIDESWALVTPYGESSSTAAAKHWQPLDDRIEEFNRKIAEAGYILDDVIQIRTRAGTPFIVDFSDLKPR